MLLVLNSILQTRANTHFSVMLVGRRSCLNSAFEKSISSHPLMFPPCSQQGLKIVKLTNLSGSLL